MKIIASSVHPDEPCYQLMEGPRMMPMPDGSRQRRWVQAVHVLRDDAIAEYAEDLGAADSYKDIQPLLMPSAGENTVAQLREHAEKNRTDTYWAQRAKQMLAESTLIQDHIDQIDMVETYKKRNQRTVRSLRR